MPHEGLPCPGACRLPCVAYTVNVSLNINGEPRTDRESVRTRGAHGAILSTDQRRDRSPAAPVLDREALANELLDELASFGARDRVGMFKAWHRGALSLVHLNVIAILEAEGRASMSRLAELLDVSVASATGIVSRMEERGLVRREHGTADRRVVLVRLSPAGARVFQAIFEQRREALAPLIAALTADQIAGFLDGLHAMHAARDRLLEATGDRCAVPEAAVPEAAVPDGAAALGSDVSRGSRGA